MTDREHLQFDDGPFRETQDGLQQLLARSTKDWEFRQKLLTDPRAALEEHLGYPLPTPLNIRFVENEADATIVLPSYEGDEFSDEELEAVLGGTFYVTSDAGMLKLTTWLRSHVDNNNSGTRRASKNTRD